MNKSQNPKFKKKGNEFIYGKLGHYEHNAYRGGRGMRNQNPN